MNKAILLVSIVSTLIAGAYCATIGLNIDPLVNLPDQNIVLPQVPYNLNPPQSWWPQITFSDGKYLILRF